MRHPDDSTGVTESSGRRAANKKILIGFTAAVVVVIAIAVITTLASGSGSAPPREPGVVYPAVGDPGCPKADAVGCHPYRQADLDKCVSDAPVGQDGLFKTKQEAVDWCRATAKSMYGLSELSRK